MLVPATIEDRRRRTLIALKLELDEARQAGDTMRAALLEAALNDLIDRDRPAS